MYWVADTVDSLFVGHKGEIKGNLGVTYSSPQALARVAQLTNVGFQQIRGDIRDGDNLNNLFKDFTPEAVIHFAGLKAVGESVSSPLKYYEQNVCGTTSLLQAMAPVAMQCIFSLLASSTNRSGLPHEPPTGEDRTAAWRMNLNTCHIWDENGEWVERVERGEPLPPPVWIEERMVTLAGEGVELAIATDHNKQIDFRPARIAAGLVSAFTPVIGNEVSTRMGHFNIFPVEENSPIPDFHQNEWEKLFDDIYATPDVRVAIINHARDTHNGFRPFSPRHHLSRRHS